MKSTFFFPEFNSKIEHFKSLPISAGRKEVLKPLIDYISDKINSKQPVKLNFICTHNSRRSQLAQVWAQIIALYCDISTVCFSGGTEVTAFHPNAIAALKRTGFRLEVGKGKNPLVSLKYADNKKPLIFYSKLYDDQANPKSDFAAIMTCSHADENCPFIPGCDARIALDYQDPKEFDGTKWEAEKYDERNDQIGSEMYYVFLQVCDE